MALIFGSPRLAENRQHRNNFRTEQMIFHCKHVSRGGRRPYRTPATVQSLEDKVRACRLGSKRRPYYIELRTLAGDRTQGIGTRPRHQSRPVHLFYTTFAPAGYQASNMAPSSSITLILTVSKSGLFYTTCSVVSLFMRSNERDTTIIGVRAATPTPDP